MSDISSCRVNQQNRYLFDCLALILLAIYSKNFIVQRGIKSIFSVPAHCQNLNILNRRKTIQQLKTISDNVLTAYIFTIKSNSIDLSFQYTIHWQPVQSLRMCSLCMLVYTDFKPRHLPTRLLGADATGFRPEAAQAAQNRVDRQSCASSASAR